jgi:hypothetical protein
MKENMSDELSTGGKEYLSRLVGIAEKLAALRKWIDGQRDTIMGLPQIVLNSAAFLWLDKQHDQLDLILFNLGNAIQLCSGPK